MPAYGVPLSVCAVLLRSHELIDSPVFADEDTIPTYGVPLSPLFSFLSSVERAPRSLLSHDCTQAIS